MTIYKVTNQLNKKVYVGCTIKTIEARWIQHIILARSGKGYALHAAMRKYGEQNFEIDELQKCNSLEEMYTLERCAIVNLNTRYPNGYNVHIGGLGGDNLSVHPRKHEIMQLRESQYPKKRGENATHYKKLEAGIVRGIIAEYTSRSLPKVSTICLKYGVSKDIVHRVLREHGISFSRGRVKRFCLVEDNIFWLQHEYILEHKTCREIARENHLCEDFVAQLVRDVLGIKIKKGIRKRQPDNIIGEI